MNSVTDLWRALIRHPLKIIGHAFSVFSIIFTLIKAITYFLPTIKVEGPYILTTIVLISMFFALKKAWKPSRVELKIPNSNTVIEIIFGDLFEQSGIRTITVNEFFDSKIGNIVSNKSLHGVLLQKCFGGHPEPFDKQIDEQLKNISFTNCTRTDGKTKLYPIGTTALISANQDNYLVFVLSKTHPETHKAYSDVTMMWIALNMLWQRARIESGGHEINLPLIGSGLSGIGLPTRDLLNLIILSAITETKSKEITQRIRIVLHRDRFDDLDLRDVKKYWEDK